MLRLGRKGVLWLKGMCLAVIVLGCGLLALVYYLMAGLPSVRTLRAYLPHQQIELAPQQCVATALTVVPIDATTRFEPALLAAEGIDTDVATQVVKPSAGASGNYSLQIARDLLCEDYRSHLRRSLDEIVLAQEIDAVYSPQQRHAIYLNQAYFGDDAVGVAAASGHYFKKSPDQLSIAEVALLAGLLRAPGRLSPFKHPDRALSRRNVVVANMQRLGSISAEDAAIAEAAPLLTQP